MKSRITLLMTVAVLFFATGLFSQDEEMKTNKYPNLKKWEIGAFLGIANYQGDLVVPVFSLDGGNNSFGYGVHLRHNFTPNWGARLNYFGSNLKGDETNFDDRGHNRAYNFETPLHEVSALLEWDILGKRRYSDGGFKRIVSPYLFVGVGFASFAHETNYVNGNNPTGEAEDRDGETSGIAVPMGGGLRFDLSEKFHVDLEAGFRTPFSDYIDGVSETGNPDQGDWYSYLGLNFAYRLSGGKDTDGDGVPDKKDQCPTVAGETVFDGCPDRDGDGVVDKKDNCPDAAGPVDLKGCPDSDGDGIINIEDQCPDAPGGAALKGCPDTDGDGVIDMEDQCPNTPGLRSMSGCPDSDGDGIVDGNDECPNEAGTALNNGCPDKDSDGDGISDSKDACPNKAGIGAFQGCPDTDGDGVQDSKDKCVTTPGPASNGGCPQITDKDREVLELAVQAVRFNTARTSLKRESYAILDQVVDILKRYPDYNVKVMGFTDDRGNAAANQTLSENRARTCADYLKSKGIASSRISSQGFGETSPLASNDTAEGRRMNRRVEFDLYLR